MAHKRDSPAGNVEFGMSPRKSCRPALARCATPSIPPSQCSAVLVIYTHFLGTCRKESCEFVSVRSTRALKHGPRSSSARARACPQKFIYHNLTARDTMKSSVRMFYFVNCLGHFDFHRASDMKCFRRHFSYFI
jgi:hypothetical protein